MSEKSKMRDYILNATTLFVTVVLFLFAGAFGYTFTKSDKSTVETLEKEVKAKADQTDLDEAKQKIETIRCENNNKIEKLADNQTEIRDQIKEVEINILKELRAMNK